MRQHEVEAGCLVSTWAGGRADALRGEPVEEHGIALATETPRILPRTIDIVLQHKVEAGRLVHPTR